MKFRIYAGSSSGFQQLVSCSASSLGKPKSAAESLTILGKSSIRQNSFSRYQAKPTRKLKLTQMCRVKNEEIHVASKKGNVARVQELLDQGVSVDTVDSDGSTPLMYAAGKQRVECVRCLLANGADPNSSNRFGWRPLEYSLERSFGYSVQNALAVREDLLRSGEYPGSRREDFIVPAGGAPLCSADLLLILRVFGDDTHRFAAEDHDLHRGS
ncbi:hypothetical protein CYMTET_25651 [Cymbomonas tetramitiformis]|uniref:Uncharacterized protein n=1 Tax=Cymbomonas tetramitiformis TaxID=36881 RepID=A0AAE0FTB4_9CHLO|nr:hypothetical protein CYMTET_25651 [Cymbomonas tetramitiformis]